jgi:hypothetical protein
MKTGRADLEKTFELMELRHIDIDRKGVGRTELLCGVPRVGELPWLSESETSFDETSFDR